MQLLDFKMIEKHPCSKPRCVGYTYPGQRLTNNCSIFEDKKHEGASKEV
jgi:hypothetical protein